MANSTGNGFVFKFFDDAGLMWGIDEAMRFYMMPLEVRKKQIARIMVESRKRFSHRATAQAYIDLYEKMLHRKLVEWN